MGTVLSYGFPFLCLMRSTTPQLEPYLHPLPSHVDGMSGEDIPIGTLASQLGGLTVSRFNSSSTYMLSSEAIF